MNSSNNFLPKLRLVISNNYQKLFLLAFFTFTIFSFTILTSKPVIAQTPPAPVGEGQCCGGLYPRCADPLICDQTAPSGQCDQNDGGIPVANELICRAPSANNPSFILPWYGDGNIPYGHFWEWTPSIEGIGAILSDLLPYVFGFAGVLLFAYLLYGGFHLITSFGSPKAVYEAWLIIFRALSGFIVIFASFWIIRIIEIVFNITII